MNGQDIDINDLLPDLRCFYKADGPLTVDHPLLRTNSSNATTINELYKKQLTLARQFFQEKQWLDLLDLFEKPYQLLAFAVVAAEMSDMEYWSYLRPAWMNTENPYQHLGLCVGLFRSSRPSRDNLMSSKDREAFENLADTLTIYRGHRPGGQNRNGISWTLDKDIAYKLGGRKGSFMANDNAEIRELTVKKGDIVAYFNGRSEQEIIYLRDFRDDFTDAKTRSDDFLEVIRRLFHLIPFSNF